MIKAAEISGLSSIDPIWHHFNIVDARLEKLGVKSWHEVQRVTPWKELMESMMKFGGSWDGFEKFVVWLRENGEPVLADLVVGMKEGGMDLHGVSVTFMWIFVNLPYLLGKDKPKYRSLDDPWHADLEQES